MCFVKSNLMSKIKLAFCVIWLFLIKCELLFKNTFSHNSGEGVKLCCVCMVVYFVYGESL